MLDVELLSKYLDESFQKVDSANGKDVVLFIGQTGAGKSTLINYQLGFGMRKSKGNAVPKAPGVPAEMGNSAEAVTFYPSTYPSSHDIVYCDCPGFEDNRGDEIRVCVSLATEALVHRARRIDAVVVVVDWRALEVARGQTMNELALILGFLFKTGIDFSGSVLFAFSHVPSGEDIDVDYIAEVAREVLRKQRGDLEKLEKKYAELEAQHSPVDEILNKIEDQRRRVSMLNFIVQNQKAIFIADVFDNGETRQFLIDRIHFMRNRAFLTKDAFDFAASDPVRKAFRDKVREELSKSTDLMSSYLCIPEVIIALQSDISEKERRIEDYRRNIQDIDSGRKFLGENDPIVTENRKRVSDLRSSQQAKKKEKLKSKEILEELQKSKWQLDSDDEMVFERLNKDSSSSARKGYTTKQIGSQFGSAADELVGKRNIVTGSVGALVLMTGGLLAAPLMAAKAAATAERVFFTYEGAPFTRVSEYIQNGANKVLTYEPKNGIYKSRFTANRMEKFNPVVEIYGAKRDWPDNKIKIQRLLSQIEAEREKIEKLSSEIMEADAMIVAIDRTIADFLSAEKKGSKEQKKNFDELIEAEEKSIGKVRQEIEVQKEKQANMLNSFEKKRSFYEKALEISSFLSLNTTGTPRVVVDFAAVYSNVFGVHVELSESASAIVEDRINPSASSGDIDSAAKLTPAKGHLNSYEGGQKGTTTSLPSFFGFGKPQEASSSSSSQGRHYGSSSSSSSYGAYGDSSSSSTSKGNPYLG